MSRRSECRGTFRIVVRRKKQKSKREEELKNDGIQADETTWQVINDNDPSNLEKFLEEFQGLSGNGP